MNTSNYVEFYIKNNESVNFSKQNFLNLFSIFNKKVMKHDHTTTDVNINSRPFMKYTVKDYFKDIVFERLSDNPINNNSTGSKEYVFRINSVDCPLEFENIMKTQFVEAMFYRKTSLPLPSFPSTSKIYDTTYEIRNTFKVTNKLFINFSVIEYASYRSKKYYHVYLNYNRNKNEDIETDISNITKYVTVLGKIIEEI